MAKTISSVCCLILMWAQLEAIFVLLNFSQLQDQVNWVILSDFTSLYLDYLLYFIVCAAIKKDLGGRKHVSIVILVLHITAISCHSFVTS